MNLSTVVLPHLPYLRRYARALTGSQGSGDAYVAALLETLIADPEPLNTAGISPKIILYKVLSTLWGTISVNQVPETGQARWERSAQQRLGQIPGRTRQIFLLKAVEGFSSSDVAQILNLTAGEVEKAYAEASEQISQMLVSRVLIIEDEPLIAMDLEDIVAALGHSCVGVARTHAEAVRHAHEKRPELILSDIQLADGSSGINAVTEILQGFDVPVIFITAYPERLLTANKPEPAFLITKPFSPDMVKALIAQALFFGRPTVHAHA